MTVCQKRRDHPRALAALAVASALAGCAPGGGMTTAALSSLPKLLPESGAAPVVGSASELYTRIGRGALTCWFGAKGPLHGAYFYHADADPPSRGGKAEILIRIKESDPAVESQRGVKAFRVTIEPAGEKATLVVENLKVPEPLGARLKGDVDRWAAGGVDCGETENPAAWSPQDPAEASPTPTPAKGARKASPAKR